MDPDPLAGWSPAPVETTARIDAWASTAFAALLDQPSPVRGPGDPLPPLWHAFHLLDVHRQADLGADGHPVGAAFQPPMEHRRRMFAGGRLTVTAPLRVGDVVTRRSRLLSATAKQGRSGASVFVTVRSEFVVDGVVAQVEEQDFAYRSQPPGTARGLAAPAEAPPIEPLVRVAADPPLLFRFSALTFNSHRIHYDHPYVTEVEGYPGLVVHGPLLALLALEVPRRRAPERCVTAFAYRLTRPAFAGEVVAGGDPGGTVVAGAAGAAPSLAGTVTLDGV
ncbi:FAS1-like dehydratase domain-containing protein [Pseudonocardia sp. CA-107938]|uniref:FAS1-like dehydratase domain-containing protein n=1 Tax=Pseudonocardia sp. CA-107938 TaxID=3240021 RepID=UPI003D93BB72